MENIFENAYFGKQYKTRDGRKAIYLGYTNNSFYYVCFIEGESNKTLYFLDGDAWGLHLKGNNADDIVSEWRESINEEELDKLAKSYDIPVFGDGCAYSDEEWDEIQEWIEESYKAGYRKAKKQ